LVPASRGERGEDSGDDESGVARRGWEGVFHLTQPYAAGPRMD
jgi:hypothetical protein